MQRQSFCQNTARRRCWWAVIFLWCLVTPLVAWAGERPLILVHGFLGWGRDEMLGYKYWGGTVCDIQEYLKAKGYVVYTASVGPISSNHDRACELFYQIKGGRVDYGAAHAARYGHHQYGVTYDHPFYPQWDAQHPIHLISHSMGGQTCRLLVELLAQDYFNVGSTAAWVKSVTTISTPHNGTTLATMITDLTGGYAEEILGALLGVVGADLKVYNFDLQQWDLQRHPDENLKDFFRRIQATLGSTKDISSYDLSPQGAADLNQRTRTHPQVYYFSYATEETYVLNPLTGHAWAEPEMNPLLWSYAYAMGHYEGTAVAPVQQWWQNDGVVNTISMRGPANAVIVEGNSDGRPGVWHYMGCIDSKDHLKICGHYQLPAGKLALKLLPAKIRDQIATHCLPPTTREQNWLQQFYLDLATQLSHLP